MISLNNQSLLFFFNVEHEGFAFVYMEEERDAEDAINRLDGIDFGRKGRRIRVEWTKVSRCEKRVLTRENLITYCLDLLNCHIYYLCRRIEVLVEKAA